MCVCGGGGLSLLPVIIPLSHTHPHVFPHSPTPTYRQTHTHTHTPTNTSGGQHRAKQFRLHFPHLRRSIQQHPLPHPIYHHLTHPCHYTHKWRVPPSFFPDLRRVFVALHTFGRPAAGNRTCVCAANKQTKRQTNRDPKQPKVQQCSACKFLEKYTNMRGRVRGRGIISCGRHIRWIPMPRLNAA